MSFRGILSKLGGNPPMAPLGSRMRFLDFFRKLRRVPCRSLIGVAFVLLSLGRCSGDVFSTLHQGTGIEFTTDLKRTNTQIEYTCLSPVEYTVEFGQDVDTSTFTASDIVQEGTLSDTVLDWNIIDSGNHKKFTVHAVSVGTGEGTILPSIPANSVQNNVGTSFMASRGTELEVNFDNGPPDPVSATVFDSDHNGKIDHFIIVFDHEVDDSTFPGYSENSQGTSTPDWLIASYSNVRLAHGTAAPSGYTDVVDDSTLYLRFDENTNTCSSADLTGCDTGSKPDLTTTTTPILRDVVPPAGNVVPQVNTATITETDGAVPIVVAASAPSSVQLQIKFSEDVQSATTDCSNAPACSAIYTISPGIAVNAASLGADLQTVTLTTADQTYSTAYTVTVAVGTVKALNNADLITGYNAANFTGGPVETKLMTATAPNSTSVELTFNQTVESTTAECSSAGTCSAIYSLPGLTISSAATYPAPATDSSVVRLTTNTHKSDTPNGYTVTIATGTVAATAALGSLTCETPYNTASFTGNVPPRVTGVASYDATHVDVVFSEAMQWDALTNGALNTANYSISGLTVSAAVPVTTGTRVRLTTTPQTSGTLYTLIASNVMDFGGSLIGAYNTGTFTGQEGFKIMSANNVEDSSGSFSVFEVHFSKPFEISTTANSVTNLLNWDFSTGLGAVSLCYSGDDIVCPINYTEGTDAVFFFKASPEPAQGAYTAVGATAVGTPAGAAGCLLPDGGTAPADCLLITGDRASFDFGIPDILQEGPVYEDPFVDNTPSGQIVVYNDKLLIGPNDSNSALFQTEYNLTGAVNITLDADSITSGYQAFQGIYESCSSGTWPNCTAGNILAGIDNMYAACYHDTNAIDSTLTGAACSAVGTEYVFVVGYLTSAPEGYQTNWYTTNKISPYVFTRTEGVSHAGDLTYRAMSVATFKAWVYQAQQHQEGSAAVRWSRFQPGGTMVNLEGRWLPRIGEQNSGGAGTNLQNGQGDAATGLISIDVMYEHDNDGTGGNESQLYIANGGSCDNDCLTNATPYRSNATDYDGGVLRTQLAYSSAGNPPPSCSSLALCQGYWEDVTPNSINWLKYMSKPLPQDAVGNGVCGTIGSGTTEDWDCLVPTNTITPAIKGIPKMVTFNGDLYMIRNACSTNSVETITTTHKSTCSAGTETPQLWRLPANSAAPQSAWTLIGALGKTTMAGADWLGGTNQSTNTANNTEVTLLAVVGDRLYIGFDNETNGANVWRTKSGVTTVSAESDFEAICQTGNQCSTASYQFGFNESATMLFDAVSAEDAGTPYCIFTAGTGTGGVKIFRTNNY